MKEKSTIFYAYRQNFFQKNIQSKFSFYGVIFKVKPDAYMGSEKLLPYSVLWWLKKFFLVNYFTALWLETQSTVHLLWVLKLFIMHWLKQKVQKGNSSCTALKILLFVIYKHSVSFFHFLWKWKDILLSAVLREPEENCQWIKNCMIFVDCSTVKRKQLRQQISHLQILQ